MTVTTRQPMPKLGIRFVNEDGTIAFAWYRLLITLWQRTGNGPGGADTPNVVYLSEDAGGIGAYLVDDNTFLGYLATSVIVPGAAVAQVLVTSPFVFTAGGPGTLTAFGGGVELSRNGGGTYYQVGLQGGAIPVQTNDKIRVSWTGASPPETIFFPNF